MKEDADQLNLLAVFYYVVAGLSALLSCIPIIYIGLGIAVLTGNFAEFQQGQGQGQPPPEFIGWLFVGIGTVAIILGLAYTTCLVLVGRSLQQRKWRVFCLVIAALSCLQFPFGTLLGVFSLIVLCRPSVIALFENASQAELQTEPWATRSE